MTPLFPEELLLILKLFYIGEVAPGQLYDVKLVFYAKTRAHSLLFLIWYSKSLSTFLFQSISSQAVLCKASCTVIDCFKKADVQAFCITSAQSSSSSQLASKWKWLPRWVLPHSNALMITADHNRSMVRMPMICMYNLHFRKTQTPMLGSKCSV